MFSIISDFIKLLRLPGLGGLATPALFGAISVGITDLKSLFLIFLVGVFCVIFGFVLNDYIDIKVDKESKELYERPLVKGTISKKTALFICFLCLIGAFFTIFLIYYNTEISFSKIFAIILFIIAAIVGIIYDLFGKRIIGSDFLIALSQGLLVLFGALALLPENNINVMTWGIFFLTFNQLLYLNAVAGGLKDADHDYKQNVKNIASKLGVKVGNNKKLTVPGSFKIFAFAIRVFSAFLVFMPFVFFGYEYEIIQILLLILLLFGVFISTGKLLYLKTFDRTKIKKIISGQVYLRYSLVPIMLVPIIGFIGAAILIFFPIIWYILLAPLSGERLFNPRM